jgi:hypothetical protein
MHPDPKQDVIDKQRVSLVGMAERRVPRQELVTSLTPAPGL